MDIKEVGFVEMVGQSVSVFHVAVAMVAAAAAAAVLYQHQYQYWCDEEGATMNGEQVGCGILAPMKTLRKRMREREFCTPGGWI